MRMSGREFLLYLLHHLHNLVLLMKVLELLAVLVENNLVQYQRLLIPILWLDLLILLLALLCHLCSLHSATLRLCSNHIPRIYSRVSTSNPLEIRHNLVSKLSTSHTLDIRLHLCSNLSHFHQHSMARLRIIGCHNRLASMEITHNKISSSLPVTTSTLVM